MDELHQTVAALVRRRLPEVRDSGPIAPDTSLTEVGLDSLGIVRLLVDVETAFHVEFPPELITADTFRTVSAIATVVQALGAAKPEQHR